MLIIATTGIVIKQRRASILIGDRANTGHQIRLEVDVIFPICSCSRINKGSSFVCSLAGVTMAIARNFLRLPSTTTRTYRTAIFRPKFVWIFHENVHSYYDNTNNVQLTIFVPWSGPFVRSITVKAFASTVYKLMIPGYVRVPEPSISRILENS